MNRRNRDNTTGHKTAERREKVIQIILGLAFGSCRVGRVRVARCELRTPKRTDPLEESTQRHHTKNAL